MYDYFFDRDTTDLCVLFGGIDGGVKSDPPPRSTERPAIPLYVCAQVKTGGVFRDFLKFFLIKRFGLVTTLTERIFRFP